MKTALGNRIIKRIKAAHAFRQVERVRELSRILINIPVREFQLIAEYYLVWCKCRDYEFPAKTLEKIIEQTQTYKTKALFSRAAIEIYQGNLEHAIDFYNEAFKGNPTVSEYIDLSRSIAGIKSLEGFHSSALRDLEKLIPYIQHAEPRLYFDFLNSYAVELSEAGHKDEARNIIKHVIASPFAFAYPEWQETARDLKEPDQSFVAVPHFECAPARVKSTATRQASKEVKANQPGKVVAFPALKEAPEPKRPEPINTQELEGMTLADKREFILSAVRTELLPETEYNKFIFMLGLVRGGPSDRLIDLEDKKTLDDLMVEWAHLIEPEQLAGVLSALRDCGDDGRRNNILDGMISKVFEYSRARNITEAEWRLKFERRLPEK